ncbi:N2,N2-dimethylguanosine tRNA methyltransferase [Ectocarpus siliculosus]|uniref:tRNA (guanine(26)-N(2))-dimethyltransferase n=1 Tax=Ectocarpus siliculosus TaxID=2880 RepID=D7FWY9_ECTSI|nr:N2,N2-dimethylguanosine tRNA methyltransferase [Ectocarpus siliculosus]|eukprot:CBJ32227.1 N2,N2-dimethylguanosine tRNA methyltransferase [Ectocarpus siliculosus]
MGYVCEHGASKASVTKPCKKRCLSQYRASVVDRPYAKEAAIRVLLHRIDKLARRGGRRVSPLLCVALDFYVRLFVLILPAPDEDADGVSTPLEKRAPPPVLWVDQARESSRFRCYNSNNRTLDSSNRTLNSSSGDGDSGGGGGSTRPPIHRRSENDSGANPGDGVPGPSSIGKGSAAAAADDDDDEKDDAGMMEDARSDTWAAAAADSDAVIMARQQSCFPEVHTKGDKRNGAGMWNGPEMERNGSGGHERGPEEATRRGLRGSGGGGRGVGCPLPSVEAVREQLRSAGHECSGSHADPRAIKTKAPLEAVREAIFRARAEKAFSQGLL